MNLSPSPAPVLREIEARSEQATLPVIFVHLTQGAIILVDVHSRKTIKVPTTLRVGSAQNLMKPCPFSHARLVIDDEAVAADIFQAALKNCSFISNRAPILFIVQPQISFVHNITKSELEMLTRMIKQSGFPIVDIQFFLNDKITDDDWQYFAHLPSNYPSFQPEKHRDTTSQIRKLKNWFSQNL